MAREPQWGEAEVWNMLTVVTTLTVALVFAVAASVVLAVNRAALRAGEGHAEARRLARRVALGMGSWLALLAIGAASGVFSNFDARPPRLLLAVAGAIGLFTAATRTRTFAKLLAATPRTWPIALQSMRVPIEIGLWALFVVGRLPLHLTFEGRNCDVLVGLTAPLLVLALSRGWLGTRAALTWNIASLVSLANIVGMAITSIPGPLYYPWPGVPNTVVAEFPFVWLPGFLVPVALFLHVISLRQLLGQRERGRDGEASRSGGGRATVPGR